MQKVIDLNTVTRVWRYYKHIFVILCKAMIDFILDVSWTYQNNRVKDAFERSSELLD